MSDEYFICKTFINNQMHVIYLFEMSLKIDLAYPLLLGWQVIDKIPTNKLGTTNRKIYEEYI